MPDYFNAETIRSKILKSVAALYEAVTVATYGVDFPYVKHGPLGNPDGTKFITIGVVAGEERKSDLYPLINSLLDITVEFSVTANKGEVPALMAEKVMGVVQQVFYNNDQLGLPDIVVLFHERRSAIDMFTYSDKTMLGMVTFEVLYRHNTQTVYSENPSV